MFRTPRDPTVKVFRYSNYDKFRVKTDKFRVKIELKTDKFRVKTDIY
jgi:hypothetical protein